LVICVASYLIVMTGLDPVIHETAAEHEVVDGRVKPGSRGNEVPAAASGFVETARGIHVKPMVRTKAWMAGSSPALAGTKVPLPPAVS